MLEFKTLQTAILAKDPAAVVQTLSSCSEAERHVAREPLAILLFALGIDSLFVQLLEANVTPDDPRIEQKRQTDGIRPMSARERNYDHKLHYMAWLASYGVAPESSFRRFVCTPSYEAESAQIMADRRPEWIDNWIDRVTEIDEEGASAGLTAGFWCRLYQHGLIQTVKQDWIQHVFIHQLPDAFQNAREATQTVLRDVDTARDVIYELPKWPYQLSIAKEWIPVIEWLGKAGLLDHKAVLSMLAETLHEPLNQTERNGCVILAKTIIKPIASSNPEIISELQISWIGLLSDPQAAVAGFALEQLIVMEKHGLLDAERAVPKIPAIFQLKPKGHALKAVQLLSRIASDSSHREQAIEGLCEALTHANKDVQSAALDAIAQRIAPEDVSVIEKLQHCEAVVAATLKTKLLQLIVSLSPESEPPATNAVLDSEAPVDLDELRQRASRLAPAIANLFQIDEALQTAAENRWEPRDHWQMTELCVTNIRQPIKPIDSVELLIEAASQAVEHSDCGDTPDRIVDAIVRLHAERDDHFDAKTDSLRSRACAHIFDRPNRGLVGGILGDAFSDLIGAWLGVLPEDEDEDMIIPERYPMGVFLRQLADRVRSGTTYPLLSTPTHQGGWIAPVTWVHRLRHIDSEKIDFIEDDLTRSMLRIAPNGRDEAWRLASSSETPLSPRFLKLAQFVLDMKTANKDLALDDSWPLQVWIVAIRARDPWVDLGDYLPDGEREQVPDEIWHLPDVFQPANYQWSVISTKDKRYQRGLVHSSPMAEEQPSDALDAQKLLSQVLGDTPLEDNFEQLFQQMTSGQSHKFNDAGFYTAKLNHLHSYPAPAYVYPYLATHWPAKLTWYWALASHALSQRVNSGSSVDERYDHYLLPLLATDQCVDRMAARALWIATTSKDANAKSMATEVWIAIIAEDRCNVETMTDAWRDILVGDWMKMNRISECFAEVAAVSNQHALLIAVLIESFLSTHDVDSDLPRDTAKLLELLDECNERLDRKVGESTEPVLQTIKSGKAKSYAKSLLARKDVPHGPRQAAILAALDARIARAERHGSAC
ncbi:DUF6493 family protein [Novipirellula sp. SH528]|uniref:DUF7824 domain-containing protein n=1 Tax=Novipirellula sp. SH528 TaxID=3454466 RepID=UPI003FA0548D